MVSLKNELVHHCRYATRAEAEASIREYIEIFYNRQRRHSRLGYVPKMGTFAKSRFFVTQKTHLISIGYEILWCEDWNLIIMITCCLFGISSVDNFTSTPKSTPKKIRRR